MLITISEDTLMLEAGKVAIFPNQTWEDYEQLLQLRQIKKFPRLFLLPKKFILCLLYPVMEYVNSMVGWVEERNPTIKEVGNMKLFL